MDTHIITSVRLFIILPLLLCLPNPAAAQVDQQLAEAWFKEAADICQRDGGKLWGVSLCGPMVFANHRFPFAASWVVGAARNLLRRPFLHFHAYYGNTHCA